MEADHLPQLPAHPAEEGWAPMKQKAIQGLSSCFPCLLLVTCFSVKSQTGFSISKFLGHFLTTLLLLLPFGHTQHALHPPF